MRVVWSAQSRRYRIADPKSGYWSAAQVRSYFGGVSDMWVRRHQVSDGFPPAVKFGGNTSLRFFKIDDVLAWARRRATTSTQ